MLFHAPEGARRRSGLTDRANGAVLALLVQACFVILLLVSSVRPVPLATAARETILLLRALPKAAARPSTIDARIAPPRAVPEIAAPSAPEAITAAPPTGLAGFGKSLFGCAPEAYGNLSPEDRAHCPKPGGDLAVNPPDLMGHPSHVKDEAHWAAELARKHSPIWLPCTEAIVTPLGSAPSINLACIGIMALQGKLTNPHDWPIYETKKYAPETLYKVQQEYDSWHKDHPAPLGEGVSVHPERAEGGAAVQP